MKILITGGAGFVGSNITEVLLNRGEDVICIDNFTLGNDKNINKFFDDKNYTFINEDLMDLEKIIPLFKNVDLVIHLAANSDISKGSKITNIDLNIGTVATYNVLESMRINNIKKIIFASSSAIYGETEVKPTIENTGPLLPISLYGASKLACEGLITAFGHNYNIQSWIYRFGNVIGRNSTHGAAYDFVYKLMKDNSKLLILGDGKQRKPYIYIDDLVSGILYGFENTNNKINYFNLSTEGNSSVNYIGECIIKHMGFKNVKIEYSGGRQGWKGDVPEVELSTNKINSIGWRPKFNSDEAVFNGTKDIVDQIYFLKNI